jgi:hypothetical protein
MEGRNSAAHLSTETLTDKSEYLSKDQTVRKGKTIIILIILCDSKIVGHVQAIVQSQQAEAINMVKLPK